MSDWEEHGSHPRIELECRRPQGLRHRRPQPGFVAGVHILDFGVIQSIDLIGDECFPADRQSILPSLASRRDRSESFTAFLHPFFLLWRRRRGGCRWSPLGGSATDISSSISSSQSISPITSRRARLIGSATWRRHCAIFQTTKTSSTKRVPSTATSSPSVTGSIATQLYKEQAPVFNRSLACFLSASCFRTNARCSRVGITSFSRRQSSKLSRSLQWKSATQRVC